MNPWMALGLIALAAFIVCFLTAWLEGAPDNLEEPPTTAPDPARNPWAMHDHPDGRTCSGCR